MLTLGDRDEDPELFEGHVPLLVSATRWSSSPASD
jgi:hypothetical protein